MIPVEYENDEFYVIDKPAGLAVQGGQGVSHSLDVDFAAQTGCKVYLVHRLDKDTRGLMMVAKNPVAASKWTKLVGSKAVKKEYVAVCAGRMPSKKGVITEKIVQHGIDKDAVTHYFVENEWSVKIPASTPEENDSEIVMSQIRLKLETGRMHQIRIHLAKQGCPIAGDDQHGNFKVNKKLRKYAGIKRLQLASVKLTVPSEKGELVFELEAPFSEVVQQ